MTNETELRASVTLTINLIPFGETRIEAVTVTGSGRDLEPAKELYVFPSETARVAPLSLTNNDVQVV